MFRYLKGILTYVSAVWIWLKGKPPKQPKIRSLVPPFFGTWLLLVRKSLPPGTSSEWWLSRRDSPHLQAHQGAIRKTSHGTWKEKMVQFPKKASKLVWLICSSSFRPFLDEDRPFWDLTCISKFYFFWVWRIAMCPSFSWFFIRYWGTSGLLVVVFRGGGGIVFDKKSRNWVVLERSRPLDECPFFFGGFLNPPSNFLYKMGCTTPPCKSKGVCFLNLIEVICTRLFLFVDI